VKFLNTFHYIKFIINKFSVLFLFVTPRKSRVIDFNQIKGINLVGNTKDTGFGTILESIHNCLKDHFTVNKLYWSKNLFDKNKQNNVNLLISNPDAITGIFYKFNLFGLYKNKNIGIFFWELTKLPEHWLLLRHWIDEVWVYSDFVKNIFKYFSKNIHKIPFVIEPKKKTKTKKYFNLPANKFIFLFVFDFNSNYERKNPEAVAQTFKKAFGNSKDVLLVIKSKNGDLNENKQYKNQLISKIKNLTNIKLIDKFLNQDEYWSLLHLCDAYISLHRAEGLGLTMAEMMSIAKPVIATNYSGNLEYMNSKNSCLVNYKLIKVKNYHGEYGRNQQWAEPNINHASYYMKKIKNNKIYRSKLMMNAKKKLGYYSLDNQKKSILEILNFK